jgi:hypothetical protein
VFAAETFSRRRRWLRCCCAAGRAGDSDVTCALAVPFTPRALAVVAVVLATVPACRKASPDRAATEDCADVETLRACWDGAGVHVTKSPTTTRARGPAFACAGDRCEQRHPRMPDTGEWQCMDSAGATVCMGGERAAGVAPAPPDPRWFCGARRGGEPGARVCVDLSPDFPDGHAHGWRCRTLHDGPARRVCERDPEAHTLGDTCDARHPCVDGSLCAGGLCLPERPAPACWREADCPEGRCRFGSCVKGGP